MRMTKCSRLDFFAFLTCDFRKNGLHYICMQFAKDKYKVGKNTVEKATILGIQFDICTQQQAVEQIMQRMEDKEKGYVVTPNSEIAYLCRKNPTLTELINRACLILPDGVGIVYASKILKQGITQKIAGVDFAQALMERMAQQGKSVFFLGAKPGVAEQAAKKLQQKYAGLRVSGCCDGYFKQESDAVHAINAAGGADVVFVCLGAPKQEQFMQAHQEEINATILCGLGGSLDVFAGTVQRAPDIFIKLGLEWLYRLMKEPRRIGRMMSLPKFMLIILKQRFWGNA